MHIRTPARGHEVHLGVVNRLRGATPPLHMLGTCAHDAAYTLYEMPPQRGQAVVLERAIVLTCSEDARHGIMADLKTELEDAARVDYDTALSEQDAAWALLWERADVQIDGDERAQRYLRFCLYHLLAAAPRHTEALSVPIKLLTGEYYQGNTFFDTDVYIIPFYLFTFPDFAFAR